jgi:hypothetical protein
VKEKIKEYRIRVDQTGLPARTCPTYLEAVSEDPHYRYFNAFTPDEAIENELSVRSKEGNASSVIHIEEYNPYANKWKAVLNNDSSDEPMSATRQ